MALDAPVLRCGLLSEAEGEVAQACGAFDVSGNKQKGGIDCQVSLLLTGPYRSAKGWGCIPNPTVIRFGGPRITNCQFCKICLGLMLPSQ